jgi:fructose/tagatose bisphosphate aldolase
VLIISPTMMMMMMIMMVMMVMVEVLYAHVSSIHIVLHLDHIQDNRTERCNFDHHFLELRLGKYNFLSMGYEIIYNILGN